MTQHHPAKAYTLPLTRLTFGATIAVLFLLAIVPAPAQDRDQSLASLPSAPSPQTYPGSSAPGPSPLTFGERAHIYARQFVSPETIIGPAFGAGIGQWEDEPPGWGEGGEGYGHRFGSGIARHEIAQTIQFAFAAVDGEDPRYFPLVDKGFAARIGHAFVATFVSSTTHGSHIPAFSRFAGAYGAAFISNSWYPSNRATAGYAARRGSTALGGSIGFHVVREFLPFFR